MSRPSRPSRSRRRDSRGAAALEAALTLPLVMLVMIGIIEMAFLMRDDVALTSVVRNGGRIASANAGAGPGGTSQGGNCISPCSPANAPMFAQMAANAMQTAGTALPKDTITRLWVYKANNLGYPGADNVSTFPASCPANCVEYKWQPSVNQFKYLSGTWTSSTVNACANNPPDAVGIYMSADHTFLTNFIGTKVAIEDHAVFSFEPLANLVCASGAHT